MNTEIEAITVPTELSDLDALIYLVRISDKADGLSRVGLYKVFSDKSWEGRYSSWNEFVQDGLKKSQPWETKHRKIHEHYTIEGGLEPERLLGIPTENLYDARKITEVKYKEDGQDKVRPATVHDQLSFAENLSRTQLKLTKNDQETTPHEPVWVTYCEECKLSKENHS